MGRQGLMDDCGYDPECSCYEECTREAYDSGYADGYKEFLNFLKVKKIDLVDRQGNYYTADEIDNIINRNCTDCVLDGTDACIRGAGRATDDEICDFYLSK